MNRNEFRRQRRIYSISFVPQGRHSAVSGLLLARQYAEKVLEFVKTL